MAGEGGSCAILAAGVGIRNATVVDEVVDTVESSGHLSRTGLVSRLM